MSLSQTQIIQSLGEALTWFEKELSWGVSPAELRHLTGRIGELYAAMITRGQMAPDTNQRGYDVVSAENERVSVKTITSSNHVTFKSSTFTHVDRVMILRLNVDDDAGLSIECLLDEASDEFRQKLPGTGDKLRYSVSVRARSNKPIENLSVVASQEFEGLKIVQYESGTIHVLKAGEIIAPARPELRRIAPTVGVGTTFDSGTEKNTRQLGADIIRALAQERVFAALSKINIVD